MNRLKAGFFGQPRPQMQGQVNPIEAIAMLLERQDQGGQAPAPQEDPLRPVLSREQLMDNVGKTMPQASPQAAPPAKAQNPIRKFMEQRAPELKDPNYFMDQGNPYAGMSAGMGFGGPSAELLRKPTGAPNVPHEKRADENVQTAIDAFQALTGNAPAEKVVTAKRPAETPQDATDLFKPPPEDSEPPSMEDSDIGKEFSAHVNEAAKAARAKGGLKTPEQADNFFRAEFEDDPYIESALQQAHQRYEAAKAESGKNPGILEYIGFALMSMAGANPFQAAEVISRRGEKFSREQTALNDLMQMQGAKIGEQRYQRGLAQNSANNELDAMAMLQREGMRGQQKASDQNYQALQAGRTSARQMLIAAKRNQASAINPADRQRYADEIRELTNRVRYFNQMLNEPDDAGVNRMLGIDE